MKNTIIFSLFFVPLCVGMEPEEWNNLNQRFMAAVYANDDRVVTDILTSYALYPGLFDFDINQQDQSGDTPLDKAIKNNNENIINILLLAGAQPNTTQFFFETMPVQQNSEEKQKIIDLTEDEPSVNYKNQLYEKIINAAQNNDILLMRQIVSAVNSLKGEKLTFNVYQTVNHSSFSAFGWATHHQNSEMKNLLSRIHEK